MGKTSQEKAVEAKVAKQLQRAQQAANMDKHRREAQNQRVAARILKRGKQ